MEEGELGSVLTPALILKGWTIPQLVAMAESVSDSPGERDPFTAGPGERRVSSAEAVEINKRRRERENAKRR